LRTTRFGNGAEEVRKITVTKPDAMAARKKDKEAPSFCPRADSSESSFFV
jgi:hypothetical protein